jgi:hypothetical protein
MSTTRPLPRVGLATILALALGMLAATASVRGGEGCALQATVGGGSATEVDVGEEVLIEGFDFPTGDVEVSFSSEGSFLRSVTATADATGFFEITVTPVAGEEGLWSVEAIADGEVCTGTTGFLVLAGPSPEPTATPAPTATAVPTATPAASALPDVAMESGRGSSVARALIGIAMLVLAAASCLSMRARRLATSARRS